MRGTAKHVIVAGGGVAGMEAAGSLAEMGMRVTLIDKGQDPGGHLLQWHALFPDRRPADEVRGYLRKRIEHESISVITGTAVEKIRHHGHDVLVSLSGVRKRGPMRHNRHRLRPLDAHRKKNTGRHI